jgi:hypothetical protein
MGLGDPQVGYDAFSPFQVVMSRDTEQGRLVFTATVKYNADGFSPETVLNAFQEFLDFLNTGTDFTVDLAQRNASGYQEITPTPSP